MQVNTTFPLERNVNVNITRKLCRVPLSYPLKHLCLYFAFFQKMDRNNDGVVTIEEFLETCQKVFCIIYGFNDWTDKTFISISSFPSNLTLTPCFSLQDENIMQSMHMFDNVI